MLLMNHLKLPLVVADACVEDLEAENEEDGHAGHVGK